MSDTPERASSKVATPALIVATITFFWFISLAPGLIELLQKFIHPAVVAFLLLPLLIILPVLGFIIASIIGGRVVNYVIKYYSVVRGPSSIYYIAWILLEFLALTGFIGFLTESKVVISMGMRTLVASILIVAAIVGYVITLRLGGWSITPLVTRKSELTTLIGETVYISKQLQSLIEAVQLYITTIVSNKSQRLKVLMILLFISASLIMTGVTNSFDSLLSWTSESRIFVVLFALFLILAVYLLGVFWFSQLQKIYFFSTRHIRNRRATQLLRELCTLEKSAQKIASLSWEKTDIGEYINTLEWLADQVISIQKFHGVLLQIVQPSWIERRYSVFPDASPLTQAFQVWALSLQESMGISLKSNLALMRAEIRVQQSRVSQLSTDSLEFAWVTELQVKRLSDLEKRLVI